MTDNKYSSLIEKEQNKNQGIISQEKTVDNLEDNKYLSLIDNDLTQARQKKQTNFLQGTSELPQQTKDLIGYAANKEAVEGKLNLLAKFDKTPDQMADSAIKARALGLKPSQLIDITPETEKLVNEAFARSNIKIDTSLTTPAVYKMLDDAQTAKIAQDSIYSLQTIELRARKIAEREQKEKEARIQSRNPLSNAWYGVGQMATLGRALEYWVADQFDNNPYNRNQRDSRLVSLAQQVDELPHDLRAGKIGEEYDKNGLGSALWYALTNPAIATSVLSQALPSIAAGGGVGKIATKVVAKGIEGRIANQALKNYIYKTSTLGTIGAVSTAGMAYQPNVVQGYQKTGNATEALNRARTQTAVDTAFGFAGGAVPYFSKGASKLGRVLNVATEATAQSIAGGAGAYYSAKAVGDEVTQGEIFVNALMGFLTTPVDIAVAGLSGGKRFDASVRSNLQDTHGIIEEVKNMALTARDAETARETIRNIKERSESPVQDVYIPAEEFNRYFQEQGIDPNTLAEQVTGRQGALEEALAAGADLQIPLENYAVDIAAKGHDAAFANELRTAPDAMNTRELGEFDGQIQSNSEEAVKHINELLQQGSKALQDSRVYNDVYGKLIEINTDKTTAERQASLYGAFFNTLAERLGVDSKALFDKYNLNITRAIDFSNDSAIARYNQTGDPKELFKPAQQEADTYRVNLDKAVNSLVSRNIEIELGNTPLVLQAVGAPNLKVRITRDVVRKGKNKHGLTDDLFAKLPELISDPIAVLKSGTESSSLVVLVDAVNIDNNPIVAAIHLDTLGVIRNVQINKVASVHGKDNINKMLYAADKAGGLLYYSNKKPLNVPAGGLYMPTRGTKRGLNSNVLSQNDIVKLYQKTDKGVNGFIEIAKDGSARINLTENANLSTFLHETGHFFLNVLGDLETLPIDNEALRPNIDAIKKWLKTDDLKTLTTEQHEQFARGFEAYLFEGKAPSLELQSAFTRFKTWLTQVYKIIKNLNVKLNDDVRLAFDRMLATDDAIEVAKTPYRETFTTAEQMGISDREFNAYKDEAVKATSEAKEKLLKDSLKEITRETRQWWKEEHNKIKEQVTNEVNNQPAYRVQDYLKKGLQTDGGKGEPVKLNRDLLVKRYGKGIIKELKGLTATDGVDPANVSMMWGYSSSDEMVKALRSAPDRNALINAETDARMRETYGDILNDGTISDRAIAAVENNGREKLLETEQRAINKQLELANKVVNARETVSRTARNEAYNNILPSDLLRKVAKESIAIKRVNEIQPHLYRNAEIKANREAFNAASRKDWETAAKAKEQERLNHFLYREAVKAREEQAKIFKYFNSFNRKATRERIGKAGGDHLEQIDALLEQYEFKQVSNRELQRRKSLAAYVREQQEQGNIVAIPQELIDNANQINYKQLSYDELQGLRDAVKNIENIATLKNKLRTAQGERDLQATKDELLAQLDKTVKVNARPKPLSKSSATLKDKVSLAKFDASLIRMEHLVSNLDGGDVNGIFHQLFWNPLADAVAQEQSMFKADMLDLMKLADKIPDLGDSHYINSIGRSFTNRELIMIALNSGNESNRAKLLKGGIDGLNLSEAHIADLLAPLTKDKWDFVQAVFDKFDNRWPDIAAMYKRLSGVEPPRVEASPIQTPYGEYKGGYFPIIYDRSRQNAPDAFIGGELFNGDFEGAFPSNGFINARNDNVTGPLKLEIEAISQHMMMQIHDLTHREALQNAYRLAKDRDIRNALIKKLGSEQADLFVTWLKNIANDANPAGGGIGSKFINAVKNNTSVVGLGFSTTTMLAQIGGVVPVIRYAGVKDFAGGMIHLLQNPLETPRFIMDKSPAMRMRWDTTNSRIEASFDRLKGKNELFRQKERVVRFAFDLLNYIDRYITSAGWLAAYNRALKEGKAEDVAIRAGDELVRKSQGGFSSMDKAAIQYGDDGKVMAMFTMFYTPFSAFYNQVRDLNFEVKNGVSTKSKAAATLLAMAFFQGVVGDLLTGQGPDDDENTLAWMGKSTLGFATSGLPVFRDVISSWTGGRVYSMSPLAQTIDKVIRLPSTIKGLAEGKENKFNKAVESTGLLLGIPVKPITRQGNALYQIAMDEYNPNDVSGFVKALIYGVRKKDKE